MRASTATALLAPLTLSLAACCCSWRPSDEAAQVVTDTSPAPVDLTLDWGGKKLPASAAAQLDRAALILDDSAAALVDYQARIGRAVTPEEKQALTQKRVHRLEAMVAEIEELRAIVELAGAPASTSSIAIVFSAGKNEGQNLDLQLDHVAVLGPREVPAGPSYRTASLRMALTALVDVMETEAQTEGFLKPETKTKLGKP